MNGRSVIKCKGCFRRNVDTEYLTEKDVLFLVKSAITLFIEQSTATHRGPNGVQPQHQRVQSLTQSAANPLPSGRRRHDSELSAFRSHFKSSRPLLPNLHPSTQHLSRSAGHGTGTGTTSSEYMTAAALFAADSKSMDFAQSRSPSESPSESASESTTGSVLQSNTTTHLNHGDGATTKAAKRENDDYFVPKQYQQPTANHTTPSLSSLSRLPEHREHRESETERRLKHELSSLKRDYHSMMRDYNDLQLLVSRQSHSGLAAANHLEAHRLRHEKRSMEHRVRSLQSALRRAQSDIVRLNEALRAKDVVIQNMDRRNTANQEMGGSNRRRRGSVSTDSMNERVLQSSDGEEDGADDDSDDDDLYLDGGGRTADTAM